ncbi:MAG: TetR/AcrR family transcriptional regulator [Bacillota bacterium]
MSTKDEIMDRRIVKSKRALKDSILSLMQMKDFKDISITAIVQEADLNRGTFYKHYQYKEDLLNEIIDDVISDLIASYREPYKDRETFEVSKLTSHAIKVFEHVKKHANFYTLMLDSSALPGFQYKLCDILKNLSMQDFDDHDNESSVNRELLSSYHSYAIFGMIIEWINGRFKYSSKYMAEQLLAIINRNQPAAVIRPKR